MGFEQVLKPTTLVGSELPPPVGPAKNWMWNGNTVHHGLTTMLGAEGIPICPHPSVMYSAVNNSNRV